MKLLLIGPGSKVNLRRVRELTYVEHGWVTLEEMNERLEALLPRFTSETIQQDPAEFRRKYKGLMQMARAVRPRTTHRTTAV